MTYWMWVWTCLGANPSRPINHR